jgi:sec-independent protein translocase protein TatC
MSQEARPDQPAEAGEMSLIGHLTELRSRLIKSLLGVAVGGLAAWNLAEPILRLLLKPVLKVLPEGQGLVFTGLQDAFLLTLKVSLWAGVMLSAPWWLYQLWAFVAPALKPGEKKMAWPLAALAFGLLLAGAAFAYFLALPLAFQFFIGFSSEAVAPLPAVDRYCSLALGLVLAFALAFQLPLALMFLERLGVIEAAALRRHRRYAILLAFVLGAVMTPPDVVSQALLAGALLLLYELSLLLMKAKKPG